MESKEIFEEERRTANDHIDKECDNLLNEVDRLQNRRRVMSNQLKNTMDFVFATARDSAPMGEVSAPTREVSVSMREVSASMREVSVSMREVSASIREVPSFLEPHCCRRYLQEVLTNHSKFTKISYISYIMFFLASLTAVSIVLLCIPTISDI